MPLDTFIASRPILYDVLSTQYCHEININQHFGIRCRYFRMNIPMYPCCIGGQVESSCLYFGFFCIDSYQDFITVVDILLLRLNSFGMLQEHEKPLKDTFMDIGSSKQITFDDVPDQWLCRIAAISTNWYTYFLVELPTDRLFHQVRSGFPIQCGREIIEISGVKRA